nr:hypothetical protein [Tanacetum cinerariifolium]
MEMAVDMGSKIKRRSLPISTLFFKDPIGGSYKFSILFDKKNIRPYFCVQATKAKSIRLYVIFAALFWWIWRYRNSVTFSSDSIKKGDLFDNICASSFSWISNRGHVLYTYITSPKKELHIPCQSLSEEEFYWRAKVSKTMVYGYPLDMLAGGRSQYLRYFSKIQLVEVINFQFCLIRKTSGHTFAYRLPKRNLFVYMLSLRLYFGGYGDIVTVLPSVQIR